VDFVRDDPTRMVTSFTSSACILFDLETGAAVTRLDTDVGVVDSVRTTPFFSSTVSVLLRLG